MTDEEILALKREHNAILRKGKSMMQEIESMASRIAELRALIPADDDDFVRHIFGAGYEIDGEE